MGAAVRLAGAAIQANTRSGDARIVRSTHESPIIVSTSSVVRNRVSD